MAEQETVAVVLSGAAARGAFQAGALAHLIPALEEQGLRPRIWLGTSAGAINAALWGSSLHLGAAAAAVEVSGVWSRMNDDDVFRPLLPFSALRTAAQFALGAVFERGTGTTSLVDTSPLARTAHERFDAGQLHQNVADGVLDAVGVVGTRVPVDGDGAIVGASSGRSVLFLEEAAPSEYPGDPKRGLDVMRGDLAAEHVLASCAIPVGFPAVRVEQPAQAAAWYLDGGVRLNAPLQPAVALGADRILLVSATTLSWQPPPDPIPVGEQPDMADAGAQLLTAALADRMAEDLLSLRRVNHLVEQASGRLTSMGGREYRRVPVMAVAPRPAVLGDLAVRIWQEKADALGWLRETDNWLIGRGIRGLGDDVGRRELLSYLFFDEDYFIASMQAGRDAAVTALAAGWQE